MPTLKNIIDSIDAVDSEATIFAEQPWTPDSEVIVCLSSENSLHPPEAKGMPYFLEVSIAKDLKEDMGNMEPEALCRRIIEYAVNDA